MVGLEPTVTGFTTQRFPSKLHSPYDLLASQGGLEPPSHRFGGGDFALNY
jgi:hypothetical protein